MSLKEQVHVQWRRLQKTGRELNFKKLLRDRPYLQGVPYWTAAGVVGIVAVIYSGSFNWAIDGARAIFDAHPYWLFVTSPLCFLLSTWLVERFAPPAGGPGVPAVIYALDLDSKTEADAIHRILNPRVALVVALSSIIAAFGAGSLGREGPMVHIAASLFYFVGHQFHRIWPYTEHRSWIVAGGAAGVASAFNAPLAGVVFVLEELAQQHFHQFKSVVISAAIVGGIVAQWLSGKYLYFGYAHIGVVPLTAIFWAILVGIFCGVVVYPFQKILQINWRSKFQNYFNTRLKFAFFTGICMAALANFVDRGSIGGGVSVMEDLLLNGEEASWSLIAARFFGPIITHLSGCAGGFLAPGLALGAALGSKFAVLADYPNHNLLVLVGMSAFLSAVVRAPFTAWVIVMEMTDRHSAIFPLMVASLVSHGTIGWFNERRKGKVI